MITTDSLLTTLVFIAAISTGLVTGIFFAFSSFVMTALAKLQPKQGIAAMQIINVTVLNRWFFIVFVGTAGVCAVLATASLLRWHLSDPISLLTGSLSYFIGTFAVTMRCSVALNKKLAHVEAASIDGAELWAAYLNRCTAWNHIRTAAA